MGLEEVSELKEARKERNSIPWAVYDVEKWERAAVNKQMGLEEASGLKEALKERNSISWAVYDVEKWEKVAVGPK